VRQTCGQNRQLAEIAKIAVDEEDDADADADAGDDDDGQCRDFARPKRASKQSPRSSQLLTIARDDRLAKIYPDKLPANWTVIYGRGALASNAHHATDAQPFVIDGVVACAHSFASKHYVFGGDFVGADRICPGLIHVPRS
jgi:hypothetical protein